MVRFWKPEPVGFALGLDVGHEVSDTMSRLPSSLVRQASSGVMWEESHKGINSSGKDHCGHLRGWVPARGRWRGDHPCPCSEAGLLHAWSSS